VLPIPSDPQLFIADVRRWAREYGFADVGIARLDLADDMTYLRRWLADGFHGGMQWLERDLHLREHPTRLRNGTLSVISARMDYYGDVTAAEEVLADGSKAYISRYALGRDYHRLMRARLLKLAQRIEQAIGPHGYRVLTDSAPALEKAYGRNAGLGWIGKNTLLLRRDAGSWFFLGEIYTDLLLPAETTTASNLCGSCTSCIDVCPTQAIVAPYRLDARRCISYLTIEHHGAIPHELRPLIGNRIFGCDDCQLVCPWNRYAKRSAEADFAPRHGLDAASLVDLFRWSEAEWLRRTEGMALRRAGYTRWLRNLAVALGNAPHSPAVIDALRARENDTACDDEVREHIAWALAQQHLRSAA
jgi:epoxyqueuosine reductase